MTLIVAVSTTTGFGGAVIAATGAGAPIALGLPPLVIYEEEQELLHPHRRRV